MKLKYVIIFFLLALFSGYVAFIRSDNYLIQELSKILLGFFLGIIGSFIYNIILTREDFKKHIQSVRDSLEKEDFYSYRFELQKYAILRDKNFYDFLLLDKKLQSFLNFLAEYNTLLKKISTGNWKDAYNLTKTLNKEFNFFKKSRDVKNFPSYDQITNSFELNREAINYYNNNSNTSRMIFSEELSLKAKSMHHILNDISIPAVNTFSAFDDILDSYIKEIDYEKDDITIVHKKILADTIILGSFGVISQQPSIVIETKDDLTQVKTFISKYKLENIFENQVKIDSLVDTSLICRLALLTKFNVDSINSFILELSNFPEIVSERAKYPMAFFEANKILFKDYELVYLKNLEKHFEEIVNCSKLPLDIVKLNITSILINRGMLESEKKYLCKLLNDLSILKGDEFYYEGYLFNMLLFEIFLENNNERINDLIVLAENAKNYSIKNSSLKILLKISSIIEEPKLFKSILGQLAQLHKTKHFQSEETDSNKAKYFKLNTPTWYFLSLPANQIFVPYKLTPWDYERI